MGMTIRILFVFVILSSTALGQTFRPGMISGLQTAGFIAPNWTCTAGVWSPNPSLGSELFTDPGLEANYTAGLCDSLLKSGAPTLTQSADVHGGAKAQQMLATAQFDRVYQDLAYPAANTWYKFSWWFKRTAGAASSVQGYIIQGGSLIWGGAITSATYTQKKIVLRAVTPVVNDEFCLASERGAVPADTVIVDDASVKAITVSNMFAVRNYGKQVGFQAALTMTANLPGGVVAKYSDASNYVMAWHDRTNIYLDKVVAGVPTNLITSATAYGAGQVIKINFVDANTAQLFYNGVQIGANQDVTTVPVGKWAGLFGTDSAVQLASPAPVPY